MVSKILQLIIYLFEIKDIDYISFTMTFSRQSKGIGTDPRPRLVGVDYSFYTPIVKHNKFDDPAELIDFLKRVRDVGEAKVGYQMTETALNGVRSKIRNNANAGERLLAEEKELIRHLEIKGEEE